MLPEAAQAMKDLFATPVAEPGTFTPAASGVSVSLRIILGQHDPELVVLGGQTARAPGYFGRIRTAELPTRPRDGDQVVVGARTFLVRNVAADVLNTSWVVDLEAAA